MCVQFTELFSWFGKGVPGVEAPCERVRLVSLPDEMQLSRLAVTLHVFDVQLCGKMKLKCWL